MGVQPPAESLRGQLRGLAAGCEAGCEAGWEACAACMECVVCACRVAAAGSAESMARPLFARAGSSGRACRHVLPRRRPTRWRRRRAPSRRS